MSHPTITFNLFGRLVYFNLLLLIWYNLRFDLPIILYILYLKFQLTVHWTLAGKIILICLMLSLSFVITYVIWEKTFDYIYWIIIHINLTISLSLFLIRLFFLLIIRIFLLIFFINCRFCDLSIFLFPELLLLFKFLMIFFQIFIHKFLSSLLKSIQSMSGYFSKKSAS